MASPSEDATPMWDIMSPEDDKAMMEKFSAESNKVINKWSLGSATFAEKDAAVSFLVQLGAVAITIQSGSQQTTSQKQVSILFGDREDSKIDREHCEADPGDTEDTIPSEDNAVKAAPDSSDQDPEKKNEEAVRLDQDTEKNREAQVNEDDDDDDDNNYSVWMTEPDDEDDDDDNQIPDPAPVVEERITTQPREEHPCPDCHTVLHSLLDLDLHKLSRTCNPQKHVFNCDQCTASFGSVVTAVRPLCKFHNLSHTEAVEKLEHLKSAKRQKRKRETSKRRDKRSKRDLNKKSVKEAHNELRSKSKNSKKFSEEDEHVPRTSTRLHVKLQPLANGSLQILESGTVDTRTFTSDTQAMTMPQLRKSGRKSSELPSDEDQDQGCSGEWLPKENEDASTSRHMERGPEENKIHELSQEKNLDVTSEKGAKEVNSEGEDDNENSGTAQKPAKGKTSTCKLCALQFNSMDILRQHMLKIHNEDIQEYKCSTCNRSFKAKPILKAHLKTHLDISDREKFHCQICKKTILTKHCYQKHMKNHVERPETFKCDTCGKLLSSLGNLQKHIKNLHKKEIVYTCEVCGKNFYNKYMYNIKEHLATHTGEKTWKCDECDFATFREYRLKQHQQLVHRTKSQCLCEICGAAFKTPPNLKQHHLTKHTDVYRFSCDVCGKQFKRSSLLYAHVKIHSNDPKDKPFECKVCNKRFRINNKLQVHMDWHNNVRKHTCQDCGKSFLTKGNLDKHRYVHIGNKPHVCRICSKGFQDLPSLRRHLNAKHQITLKKRVTAGVRDERIDNSSAANISAHELGERPSSPSTLVIESEDRSEGGDVHHHKISDDVAQLSEASDNVAQLSEASDNVAQLSEASDSQIVREALLAMMKD